MATPPTYLRPTRAAWLDTIREELLEPRLDTVRHHSVVVDSHSGKLPREALIRLLADKIEIKSRGLNICLASRRVVKHDFCKANGFIKV